MRISVSSNGNSACQREILYIYKEKIYIYIYTHAHMLTDKEFLLVPVKCTKV